MIPVCGTKILYAAGCNQKKLDSESMLNTNLRNIWLLKENNTLDKKGKTLTLNKRSINFQIPPPPSACTVGKTSRTGRTAGAPGKHSPPVFQATKGRPLLRRLRPQPALEPVRGLPNRTAPGSAHPVHPGAWFFWVSHGSSPTRAGHLLLAGHCPPPGHHLQWWCCWPLPSFPEAGPWLVGLREQ